MSAEADIVIVNWNSGPLLAQCLASIESNPNGVGKVVVVDNGSADGSADVAAGAIDLEILRTGRNEGFARACNIGAARCRADYILFLNPDARLVSDGLARALSFMGSSAGERIGICGVRLVGADGTVQRHCANFTDLSTYVGHAAGLLQVLPALFTQHFMRDFDHLSSRPVDQVIGAYFLVRRTVFDELGGFDERFFVYFEEVDFALRARQVGWGTYYLADATAYHLGGGTSDQVRAHRLFYSLRSRMLYGFKHFPRPKAWLLVGVTMLIEPWSRLARAAMRRSRDEIAHTLRGYRMLYRDAPRWLAMARR